MKKTIRIITAVILLIILTVPSYAVDDQAAGPDTEALTGSSVQEEQTADETEKIEDTPEEAEQGDEDTEIIEDTADIEPDKQDIQENREDSSDNAKQEENKQSEEKPAAEDKEAGRPAAVKAAPVSKASPQVSANRAGGNSELTTITWKMTAYHEFFGVGYHQRKLTHINDTDVNTQSDMQASYAFCVEPREIGPEGWDADTGDSFRAENGKDGLRIYTYNGSNAGDYAMMRKMCYYLPGGYGWNRVTSRWYRDYMDSVQTNEFTEYTLSATVLAKQWAKDADDPEGNANYGYTSLSTRSKALVDRFLREVPGLPDPPASYIAFYVEKDECQDIWGSLYAEPESGNITVIKKSSLPSLTDALTAGYSLTGARYYVYTDQACKTRARDLYDNEIVLTTDKNGKTPAVKVAAGEYWVREVTASKGYELDTNAYHVTVASDKTVTATSTEQPIYAQFNALLEKQSEEYGYKRLLGAEYTLSYYEADPGTQDVSGLTPKKTWVFRTREGKDPVSGAATACIDFMNDTPVSGGSMYTAGGKAIMPVGVFTLKETKAPRGLAVDPKTYVGKVIKTAGDAQAKAVLEGSDILYVNYTDRFRMLNTESVKTVRLILQKKDADTGKPEAQGQENDSRKAAFGSLEGAVYKVYLNDPTVMEDPEVGEMITDSSGRAELDKDARTGKGLMPGTYYIMETEASPGYTVDSYAAEKQNGRYQDGKHVVVARVSEEGDEPVYDCIFDSMEAPHHTVIRKTDVTSGNELPGARLQVIDSEGQLVEEWISGDKPHDIAALPDGKYILREITAPYGYETAEDAEFEVKADQVVCEVEMKNRPVTVTTTAKHLMTGTHTGIPSGECTITDVVMIEGLTRNRTYKVSGTLMDRKTGKPVTDSSGKPVKAEKEFTADKEDLSVELTFPVDQKAFGKDTALVVFETLYRTEESDDENAGSTYVEIQKHEDLSNEDQTIRYGGIAATEARDKKSGTHNASPGESNVITDTVRYANLSVKDRYLVMGELYDKTEGKLTGITSSQEFTPDKPDGSVEVEFSFSTEEAEDHDFVVFEKLYVRTSDNKIVLVNSHEEPEDKAQTVHIDKRPAGPKTGDNTVLYIYLSLTAAALIALLQMIRKRMKEYRDQL